jgi:hypothetical protein
MLEKCVKYLFLLLFIVAAIIYVPAARAESTLANYDPCVGAQLDCAPGLKGITKVRPAPVPGAAPLKVKSQSAGWMPRFEGISQFSPANWWAECCLPAPAKGQFWVGPKVFFPRIRGEARRGGEGALVTSTRVNFDDHLGLRKSGNVMWSLEALYQIRPRWGIRYSFSPLFMEAVGTPNTAFTFAGTTFTAGTTVASKWEHIEHRAGLVFNLSRSVSSLVNVFADWMYLEDKLTIGAAGGLTTTVTYDDTKNLAVLGLEFEKCLKNYQGNTLSVGGKGGIAFLSDSLGYEAEAALSYLIPIKTGRFGFVKGGYKYSHMKKHRTHELFDVTMDGPFVQVGFLF